MQREPSAARTQPTGPSRRDFVRTSAAVAAAATVAGGLYVPAVHAAEGGTIKIGLIGCGGRGGGAAKNALNADPNVKLVAMGDAFKDRLDKTFDGLKAEVPEKVDVADDKKFIGLDAYKAVIDVADVVLLATPPHFRPMHLEAAIKAGKHVFCEKPVGVDVPSVKRVIDACALAKEKNLNVVSGLCYRYDEAVRETIEKVHDGAIGDVVALQGMYLTGALWSVPRTPKMTDFEYQLRNWLYYTWLSGDHIVEQHIHTLDKMLWLMKDVPPNRATSNGGRTVRTEPEFGNIYDHFDTIYEWDTPRGPVRAFCQTRQWIGADTDTSDFAFGTKGTASVMGYSITGENKWRRRPAQANMYDAEHVALFKAIRSGQTINNGDYMTKATLMGIMGRMAAYTGKAVYWDKAAAKKAAGPIIRQGTPMLMETTEVLAPSTYAWDAQPPESKIAVPGNKSAKPAAAGATEH